ncbi:TetR family transcriptional regulator [Nocardia sp. alder85J]|uniref:TetR family transcriptional regulator n=1 Tax=Nocardia sp. alder85J TaxID=2862949 RepID=UPI001CD4DE14|nr:TetR family transcriptional regulator [Nocardia sp. alder85J]
MDEDSGSGAAIRAARRAAGLTVRELAQRVGVSAATVSAVENDRTGVSVARLRAFATALGVPVTRLLTAPDDPAGAPAAPALADDWRHFAPLTLDPVLTATIGAIVDTGYHGTSMRAIAQRAGLSVAGVYHHYADKQQLLVRILDLTMAELHWRVGAAAASAPGSVERVARIVEALTLFHAHRRDLGFIGASEMRSLTAVNRRRITESRTRLQRTLDDAIGAAAAEGRLHAHDLPAAGRAIATMCTAVPQWFRADGPSTPEDIARRYAEYALALLNIRPAGNG